MSARRRRHHCESCAHSIPRTLRCDRPCPKCGGRMLLTGRRGPGRPRLDLRQVKVWLPEEWLTQIGRGRVQRFIRDAVGARLED